MNDTTSYVGTAVSSLHGTSWSTVPLALIVAAGIAFYSTKNRDSESSNLPKVRGGLPVLGHAVEFGTNTKEFLERCKREYGRAFQFSVLGKRFVIVDSSFRDAYFSSKALNFTEGVRRVLPVRQTVGIGAIENTWHVPLLKSQFSVKNLTHHDYLATIQTQVDRVLKQELKEEIYNDPERLAWRCIAACSAVAFVGPMLGQRKDLLDVFVQFHKAVQRVIEAYAVLPESLLWLVATDVKKHTALVRSIVLPEIRKRKENGHMPSDMLSAMIRQGRTDEEIAKRMMSFIMGSMVTSAGVLTHVLLDLAAPGRGIDAREDLEAEQRYVVQTYGQNLTHEALDHMPRLKSFCWETMRTSNPPIQIVRWSVSATSLQSTYQQGATSIQVPKDSMVAFSGLLMEQEETLWGDTAHEFRADRFLDKTTGQLLTNDPSTLGLFSFGIGRNICPGRHFAMAEVMGTMATVLRNFEVETVSGNLSGCMVKPSSRDRIVEPVRFKARKL